MDNVQFYKDINLLVNILPEKVKKYLNNAFMEDVIEIVLDIGRLPEVRHAGGKIDCLGSEPINSTDLEFITQHVAEFTSDNRSGIPGTLHRISAIRNRQG